MQKNLEIEAIKQSGLLIVYSSTLGHITHKVRGQNFENKFIESGWRIKYIDESRSSTEDITREAKDYGTVYFIKVSNLELYKSIKQKTSCILVFDFLDALWHPNFKFTNWGALDDIIVQCDALITENKWVKAYISKYKKPIYLVSIPIPRPNKFISTRSLDNLTIGWIGSESTIHALNKISSELILLLKRYSFLNLLILGAKLPNFFDTSFGDRIQTVESYDEHQMIESLLKMDIGLYPPPSTIKEYEIRGAQKTYIYMAAGVAPICLNAGDSAQIIIDGSNGVLINKQSDWYSKIESYIKSPETILNMRRSAYNSLSNKFTIESSFRELEKSLFDIYSNFY